MKMLKTLYKEIPENIKIRLSGVTGYGEKLIQSALNMSFILFFSSLLFVLFFLLLSI